MTSFLSPPLGTLTTMDGFAERIAHVDMDAFFVEVERLRRPELVGRPVLIGGTGPRSVVAAASYEARQRGARSAMPMAHATRLCPAAVVVSPDHTEYRHWSRQVFEVLETFTPRCEPVSVDEAFLDIGGLRRHFLSPDEVGEGMRTALRETIGLPASVGIASTKLVAKMASRAAKPDGLFIVRAGDELSFLHPQPVRDLWGVGEATHARLEELGIKTIGDLAAFPRATLQRRLGSVGAGLWDLANGIDDREVDTDIVTKSISVEETYTVDLTEDSERDRALVAHADNLARAMRKAAMVASTVTVKIRFGDFTTLTRSRTMDRPVGSSADILEISRDLVASAGIDGRGVRLLGIAATGLSDAAAPRQLGLEDTGWELVDEAVDQARERFGKSAVTRGSLTGTEGDAREETY